MKEVFYYWTLLKWQKVQSFHNVVDHVKYQTFPWNTIIICTRGSYTGILIWKRKQVVFICYTNTAERIYVFWGVIQISSCIFDCRTEFLLSSSWLNVVIVSCMWIYDQVSSCNRILGVRMVRVRNFGCIIFTFVPLDCTISK